MHARTLEVNEYGSELKTFIYLFVYLFSVSVCAQVCTCTPCVCRSQWGSEEIP